MVDQLLAGVGLPAPRARITSGPRQDRGQSSAAEATVASKVERVFELDDRGFAVLAVGG